MQVEEQSGTNSMTMSKDLIAASATPLILSILSKGDSYGYDIIHKVSDLTGGQMQWADGMLYPILHRLEKKGFVESYWGKAASGRRRRYYGLRKPGLQELKEQRQNWSALSAWMQKLDGEKPCLS
jgi:PadR family transcriptional regulator PadR